MAAAAGTLRRKRRKFEEASGGELDLRTYHSPDEMDEFVRLALPLSQRTYQARLLDAGLPDSETARAEMRELAWQDRVRAFLLFLDGKPVAYLYLPIERDTLVYAHLGHDPDHADPTGTSIVPSRRTTSRSAEVRPMRQSDPAIPGTWLLS